MEEYQIMKYVSSRHFIDHVNIKDNAYYTHMLSFHL